MKETKNVLVIGAGPSGLVAMKELLEKGHQVTCLEKSAYIGGAFAIDKVYDTLYLTISNLLMAFSDFPPADGTISYSSAQEYRQYLEDYTTHFKLWDCIHFNTKVVHAKLDANTGGWKVQAEKDGQVMEFTPEVLIVATGANHKPRYIDLPGYTGEVSHSVDYRDANAFRGKKVLVVGVGESSSDMAHDIAEVANSCSVWSRHYIVLGPRYLTMIDDPNYDEAKLLKTQAQRTDPINIFLETITTNRLAGWLPGWYFGLIRQIVWKKQDKLTPFTFLADWSRIASRDSYFRADQPGIVTKNGSLSVAHAQGKINSIVSKTAKFDGKKVVFPETIWYNGQLPEQSERSIEVDHILLCTGFQTDFSWLEVDFDWSPRSWYKHCFPAGELGHKLMFLGWTRPHQGGIPACAEMLSRYIALILSGERSLPKNHGAIAQYEGRLETKYYAQHPNVPVVVDLPAFMESIATLIGCLPKSPSLWNLERFGQYWLYPSWPCWYRERGPGAKPEALEKVLNAMPLSKYFEPNDPVTWLGLPIAVSNYLYSLIPRCIPLVSHFYRKAGLGLAAVFLRPRKHVLHGNDIPPVPLAVQVIALSAALYSMNLVTPLMGVLDTASKRSHLIMFSVK